MAGIGAIMAAPGGVTAQPSDKRHRIGLLAYQPCGVVLDRDGPFLRELRERHYSEGHNLLIECRDAIGEFDRLRDLAEELVGLGVDLLVTEGTPQSVAGKRATTIIPIVMVGVGDPVGSGLVESLARPGGNVTGSSMFPAVDVVVKGLELLKRIAPTVVRVGVLWDPKNRALVSVDRQLDEATEPLQIRLVRISIRAIDDIEPGFNLALDRGARALLVHPLPVGPGGLQRIFQLALQNGVPAITWAEPYARMPGVLFSYGPDFGEVYRRAAALVDKILKGAAPAALPVEQPSRFRFILNLGTARALSLMIPASVLARADRVID
jgi:putative ABC transport system substrate-binding protein